MRPMGQQAAPAFFRILNNQCVVILEPAMISAASLSKRGLRIIARVFPRCSMISQAIAFNLFLAFFPTLLLTVAIATSRWGSQTNMLDLITNFTKYLPPGSRQLVSEFLIKRGPQAWKTP